MGDKGLPFLKVKLIQKKDGAFPMVKLEKEIKFEGEPGAVLKQYDDEWYGSKVTMLEMDGEIDMDKMEDQLKEIEGALGGLGAKSASELTEAMVNLKSSPLARPLGMRSDMLCLLPLCLVSIIVP